jgi:hypothetical protein
VLADSEKAIVSLWWLDRTVVSKYLGLAVEEESCLLYEMVVVDIDH